MSRICTICGYEGTGKRQLRGSSYVERLLWTVLVIPGPFYTLWRHTGRSPQCPNCAAPTLVKLKSDRGQLARQKFDAELGIAKKPEAKTEYFGKDRSEFQPRKTAVDPNQF